MLGLSDEEFPLVYLPRYALKSIGGGELRRRPVEPPKPSLVVVVAPRHQRARAFSKVEVGAFCYVLGDRVPYRPPAAFVFARGRFRVCPLDKSCNSDSWESRLSGPTITMLAPADAAINSVNNVCAGVRLRIA